MYNTYYDDYLMHYGVKGMKWGRRRYQNTDGSLTAKGIKKYAKAGYSQDAYNSNGTRAGKVYDKLTGAHKYNGEFKYASSSKKANQARAEKYVADKEAAKAAKNTPEAKAARRKKMIAAGAAVAGTALAAYGAYKVSQYVKDKKAAQTGQNVVAQMMQAGRTTVQTTPISRATVHTTPISRGTLNSYSARSIASDAQSIANQQRELLEQYRRLTQR